MTFVCLDIETTGLIPFFHNIWEVGYVLEPEGEEVLFQIKLSPQALQNADPKALEINRYHERVDNEGALFEGDAVAKMAEDWAGRSLIAQPALFDLTFIRNILFAYDVNETWSHRAVHDLKTFHLGRLYHTKAEQAIHRQPGIYDVSGDDMAKYWRVPKPKNQHSALADAIWTRDLARSMGAI